jgi:hypothetical protein
MEYLLTFAVLGVPLLALWLRKRLKSQAGDDASWVLLLVPGDSDDAQGRQIARFLGRMKFQVRHLSETGMELSNALRNLRPSLIIAHQPMFGDAIERLEQEDSALSSTPVLYLDTSVQKGRSELRAYLPAQAKPSRVASLAIDLLNRRPGPRELSRREAVQLEIAPGKVMEFIHFLHTMEKSGKVEIRTRQVSGWAWLEKGRIVHAAVGQLEGLDALHSMLDFVQGTMTFSPGVAPARRNIRDGAMAVLAEYARQRDELAKASGN